MMKRIFIVFIISLLCINVCDAKSKRQTRTKHNISMSLEDATLAFANKLAIKTGGYLSGAETYYTITFPEPKYYGDGLYGFDEGEFAIKNINSYLNIIDLEYSDVEQRTAWNNDNECLWSVAGRTIKISIWQYSKKITINGIK